MISQIARVVITAVVDSEPIDNGKTHIRWRSKPTRIH